MHIDEVKPEGVENEAVEQIGFADRILLSKTDLVTPEEVEQLKKKIKGINTVAKIFECQNGKIDLDLILNVEGFNLSRVLEMDPEFLAPDQEHQVML